MYKFIVNKSNGNLILDNCTFEYKDFSNENYFLENLVNLFNFFSDYINDKRRYRLEIEFFEKKYFLYFVFQDQSFFSLSAILIDFVGNKFHQYDHDGNLSLVGKDFELLYEKNADCIDDLDFIYFYQNWGVTKVYYDSKSSMVFWSIKFDDKKY